MLYVRMLFLFLFFFALFVSPQNQRTHKNMISVNFEGGARIWFFLRRMSPKTDARHRRRYLILFRFHSVRFQSMNAKTTKTRIATRKGEKLMNGWKNSNVRQNVRQIEFSQHVKLYIDFFSFLLHFSQIFRPSSNQLKWRWTIHIIKSGTTTKILSIFSAITFYGY